MPKPEPAFPSNPMWGRTGMTLRDWFAGTALQGLLASCANPDPTHNPFQEKSAAGIAIGSYTLADAMLKAREVE